jgi:hypothetical protein
MTMALHGIAHFLTQALATCCPSSALMHVDAADTLRSAASVDLLLFFMLPSPF